MCIQLIKKGGRTDLTSFLHCDNLAVEYGYAGIFENVIKKVLVLSLKFSHVRKNKIDQLRRKE